MLQEGHFGEGGSCGEMDPQGRSWDPPSTTLPPNSPQGHEHVSSIPNEKKLVWVRVPLNQTGAQNEEATTGEGETTSGVALCAKAGEFLGTGAITEAQGRAGTGWCQHPSKEDEGQEGLGNRHAGSTHAGQGMQDRGFWAIFSIS
eukprot:262288-Pelagomonas_calceolata.AAC.2